MRKKEGKKGRKAVKKVVEKVKEKGEKKVVKKKVMLPKRILKTRKLQRRIKQKQRFLFKGRFGKRTVRRVGKKKWQRWRKPRGIDIHRRQEDGKIPRTGYKTRKEIRFLHPSGFYEKIVRNVSELRDVPKEFAVRISSVVGKKKKGEIIAEAKKQNLKILNP